jgi:hypothetical protein
MSIIFSGGNGRRIAYGPFLRELKENNMTDVQRERRCHFLDKVIDLREDIHNKKRSVELLELAKVFARTIFEADSIDLVIGQEIEECIIKPLADFSLAQNRLVYIPDCNKEEALVSGQVRTQLYKNFSTNLRSQLQAELDFDGVWWRSLAISPLVTGFEKEDLTLEQYVRRGFLALYSSKSDFLYGIAGMIPLRMFTDNVSLALAKLI